MGIEDRNFADWRTPKGTSASGKIGAKDAVQFVEPPKGVTWYDPWTWSNSYLFNPRPEYDQTQDFDQGQREQQLQEEGRRQQDPRDSALFAQETGDGLTPIERHKLWVDRDKGDNESLVKFYPVEREADFGSGLAGALRWRDSVLARIADNYINSQDPRFQYDSPIGPPDQPGRSIFTDPGDRGRSGSGRGGPQYVGPDRRTIEEFVGDKMIVLTGKRQPELQAIVDKYMKDHKAQSEGASIDPGFGVLSNIRELAEYKRIHTLRAEATDENTWVNRRQDRLTQLGVGQKAAAARGIELAAIGTNLVDIDVGKFQMGRGRKDITLMNQLAKTADQMGRLL